MLVLQSHPYLLPDCTVLEQHDLYVCLMTVLRFLEILSALFLNIGNTLYTHILSILHFLMFAVPLVCP